MTDKHEWPTAPIIQAVWVPLPIDWTATIGTWTRGGDGNYYNTSKDKVAREGEGRFTDVTEYWPLDHCKDEVQHLQRALAERNIIIRGLRKELEEQPDFPCCGSDPTTFVLPPEPEGPVWDKNGDKWVQTCKNTWKRTNESQLVTWTKLLYDFGPLTSTPPDKLTWRVGDTIPQGYDLRALPTGTILKAKHTPFTGKILHKIGPCELEVTGLRGKTYPAVIQYPVTILWLPEETEND